jgi:hypothetical protein
MILTRPEKIDGYERISYIGWLFRVLSCNGYVFGSNMIVWHVHPDRIICLQTPL